MVDPLKELNKVLGVASNVQTLQKEPWNHKETPEVLPTVVENNTEECNDIEKDYRLQRDIDAHNCQLFRFHLNTGANFPLIVSFNFIYRFINFIIKISAQFNHGVELCLSSVNN